MEAEALKILGSGGDPVQATRRDLMVERVLRKLSSEPGDVSPARITLLVREAFRGTEEWAQGAQKFRTRLDIQESIEDQED